MSLRRTAIARRTELRRSSSMPRRTRETKARAERTIGRQRATGPTPAERALVADRAAYACEICGRRLHDGDRWVEPHSFHHRRPRGMGGTSRPDANAAHQLLLLCGTGTTGCHGVVEATREASYAAGWLVHQADDPAAVPVQVWARMGPVLLAADGTYRTPTTSTATDAEEPR